MRAEQTSAPILPPMSEYDTWDSNSLELVYITRKQWA